VNVITIDQLDLNIELPDSLVGNMYAWSMYVVNMYVVNDHGVTLLLNQLSMVTGL
jgi:hypothetical protein